MDQDPVELPHIVAVPANVNACILIEQRQARNPLQRVSFGRMRLELLGADGLLELIDYSTSPYATALQRSLDSQEGLQLLMYMPTRAVGDAQAQALHPQESRGLASTVVQAYVLRPGMPLVNLRPQASAPTRSAAPDSFPRPRP